MRRLACWSILGIVLASCGGSSHPPPSDPHVDAGTDASDSPPVVVPIDADEDGRFSRETGGEDCDDTDASVFPGAPDELGDGIDQDCDGVDGIDADGDGEAGTASGGADCDDQDPLVHTAAAGFESVAVHQGTHGADVALTLGQEGIPRIAFVVGGRVDLATPGEGDLWAIEDVSQEDWCSSVDMANRAGGAAVLSYVEDGTLVVAEGGGDGWVRTRGGWGALDQGTEVLADPEHGATVVHAYDYDVEIGCEYACSGDPPVRHIDVARVDSGRTTMQRSLYIDPEAAPVALWALVAERDGQTLHLAAGVAEGLAVLTGTADGTDEWMLDPVFDHAQGADLTAGPRDDLRLAAVLLDDSLQLASSACGGWHARALGVAEGQPRVAFGPDGTLYVAWIDPVRGLSLFAQRGPGSTPAVLDPNATGGVAMAIGADGFVHLAYLAGNTLRYATGPGRPGRDLDCDGTASVDVDADGHAPLADGGLDCDDTDSAVGPFAVDAPGDGRDSDCDGTDGVDRDGDGHLDADDCDDSNPDTF